MTRRRRPRIISKEVAGSVTASVRCVSLGSRYNVRPTIPRPPKTDADRLYDLIYDKAVVGYCFTDNEFGIPWIERSDIEERDGGVFIVRFRCPPDRVADAYFGIMADAVCSELNCGLRFVHMTKTEYGLPFEDCVWILQKDELDINEAEPVTTREIT